MPTRLVATLKWGGLAITSLAVVTLLYVWLLLPAPEDAAPAGQGTSPFTRYWVLLAVGLVAMVVGFAAERVKSGDGGRE